MSTIKGKNNTWAITIAATILATVLLMGLIWYGKTSGPGLLDTNAHTKKIVAAAQAEPGGIMFLIHYKFEEDDVTYSGTINCSTCGKAYFQARETGLVDLWVDPNDLKNVSVEKPNLGLNVFLHILYWGAMLIILLVYVMCMVYLWDAKSKNLRKEISQKALQHSAFFKNPKTSTLRVDLNGYLASFPITVPMGSKVQVGDVIVNGYCYYVYIIRTPKSNYPQGEYITARIEYLQNLGLAEKPPFRAI